MVVTDTHFRWLREDPRPTMLLDNTIAAFNLLLPTLKATGNDNTVEDRVFCHL